MEAYDDVFSRAATSEELSHFDAQLAYFRWHYETAGQNAQLALLHAKRAVIGQKIGHAVLDEEPLRWADAAEAFLLGAGKETALYGEPLGMI